jgi:hypothetical protein
MNLVGRLNIKLSEILCAFPNAPNAAERDLQHRSSNLTFFRLAGTLALFGTLFVMRHVATAVSNWLNFMGLAIGVGLIAAVLLLATLVAVWVVLIRRWRRLQSEPPDLPQIQRSLVRTFQEFEGFAKHRCPGIEDGLHDTRLLLVRVISDGNEKLTHRLVSQLIHFVRSTELLELVTGKMELETGLSRLDSALVVCLEGKELLPLQLTNIPTQEIELFNPVTTQTF